MVRLISVLIFVIAPNYILGQPVIKRPVVYQLPAMSKVTTKEKIEFRKAREKYRADSTFQPFYNGVIREDVLNANAYILLRDQRQNEALELFKLLVESYPESPNAYDGLADAYEALGNKAEALVNAQKALVKLETATNLSPQFKEAVKKSASEKLSRLKTGS